MESALPLDGKIVSEQQEKTVVVFGRFMLPDMTEHPCQVAKITTSGAIFLTNVDVPGGVQVVAYVDELGRIEAQVAEPVSGGFKVTFKFNEARELKFAERLGWLHSRDQDGSIEQREHQRVEPDTSTSHITLPDGRVYPCEVIDISLSGAAVSTEVMPALGTYVMLGKMRGRVVRYIDNGVAIEFSKQLEAGGLGVQL